MDITKKTELALREIQENMLLTPGGRAIARGKALGIAQYADVMAIKSLDDARLAGELVHAIKEAAVRVEDHFRPIISAAYKAHRELTGQAKEISAPLEEAEGNLKRKIVFFQTEERRRAAEKAAAEADRLRREEEAARINAAIEAEESGDKEAATAILNEPLPTITAVTQATHKLDGIALQEYWTYEIADETQIPREFLAPDHAKLSAYCKAMGSQAKVPGVVFTKRERAVARTTGRRRSM